MKRTSIVLPILLLGLIAFFSSCDTGEEEGPSLRFFGGDFIDADTTTVEPESFIKFSFIAEKGDNNLESFEVTRDGAYLQGFPNTDIPKDTYDDTLIFVSPTTEGTYNYTFTVYDNKEKFASESFIIVVKLTGGPVTEWTEKLGSHQSITGSSFASTNGQVYQIAEAKANSELIDFLYFYGVTNLATLAAPDDSDAATVFFGTNGLENWSTLNKTRFKMTSLTVSEFDAIEDDLLIVANATGADASKVNELAEGDVVAFITDSEKSGGSKMGLVKIGTLNTGADGDMVIAVKVQE